MKNILLISENFLRANFNISENVQSKFILPAIRNAQKIKYQEVVGSRMLKKLESLVESGDIEKPENENYKDLLDQSQLFIGYSAISELCVICNVKIDNIGLNATTDENVSVMRVSDMFEIKRYYQDKADYYCKLLQKYILQEKVNLPEICKTKVGELKSNLHSAASCGLSLGGERGKGVCRRERRR